MKPLRLIADDLTGALDTAAQFTGAGRAVPVFPGGLLPEALPRDFAIDAATREMDGPSAAAAAVRFARLLATETDAIAYKKVDSLLRGHPGLELAATLRTAPAAHCMIAPAFPLHGRVTRGGRQFSLAAGASEPFGDDIRATLVAQGIPVGLRSPGEDAPEGVSLWDAQTDEDLRLIAGAGARLRPPPLWCGSGGLAAAIANAVVPGAPRVGGPLLGLFGSDHPVTAVQLERCAARLVSIADGEADAGRVGALLEDPGACLVRCALAGGMDRAEAALRISREFGRLVARVPRPGTLLVSGGETLRSLCQALGTHRLDVVGQLIPGVPVSRIVGGVWDGTLLVSKSGSFGDDELLLRILAGQERGA